MFKFLHCAVYGCLSVSYAGAALHFIDKDVVTAATAVLYLLLAALASRH